MYPNAPLIVAALLLVLVFVFAVVAIFQTTTSVDLNEPRFIVGIVNVPVPTGSVSVNVSISETTVSLSFVGADGHVYTDAFPIHPTPEAVR